MYNVYQDEQLNKQDGARKMLLVIYCTKINNCCSRTNICSN